jgi:hypothetical protein
MKEEIKKKIEEEMQPFEKHEKLSQHLKFAANNWMVDSVHWNGLLEEINKICLAQQSVNSELLDRLKECRDYIYHLRYQDYVKDMKPSSAEERAIFRVKLLDNVIQSASQNQQNEKTAPSLVVEEAMKVTQKDVRVPNSIRTGEVTLSQQNEKESETIEYIKWAREYVTEEYDDNHSFSHYLVHGNTMQKASTPELLYELFKLSKTKSLTSAMREN